jgi:hypothetical protein
VLGGGLWEPSQTAGNFWGARNDVSFCVLLLFLGITVVLAFSYLSVCLNTQIVRGEPSYSVGL